MQYSLTSVLPLRVNSLPSIKLQSAKCTVCLIFKNWDNYFSKPKQMKAKRDRKTSKYKVIQQVHPYEDISYKFYHKFMIVKITMKIICKVIQIYLIIL